jgi:intein/homing endonuclease
MKNNNIKVRQEDTANYKGVFFDGKTLRLQLDKNKPITELDYPEFYDVAINSKCNAMCPECVIAGSLINTKNGDIPIEMISEGVGAYTFNEELHSKELNTVSQLHKNFYSGELINIELENGKSLTITPNHKVYTKNRGWVPAGELMVVDELLDYS